MAIPRNLANIAPHMNASSTELVVNDGGADLNFRVEGDSDANLLFVDAGAEIVGIGTNTPAVKLHVAGTGNANSIMTNQVFRIAGGGNALNFGDDGTDSLIGVGNSSSNLSILSRVAGVYSKTLTVNSDSTIKTAATISVGNATPSASGAGITFPATQSAASDVNTLDDYEEGSWTPTYLTTATNFTSITYDTATRGQYTKIGNMVFVKGFIMTDSITVGSASGAVCIGNLPFAAAAGSYQEASGSIGQSAEFGTDNPSAIYAQHTQVYAVLFKRATSVSGTSSLLPSDMGTGSDDNQVFFAIAYRAA